MEIKLINNTDVSPDTLKSAFTKANENFQELKARMWYGIEWDTTVSNPACTRIGAPALHQSLPIQSMMRRCVLKDDGTVNYYLHPNDSTKRDNGAAADLTGAHGQVMTELPEMYIRFEAEGNKRRCLMSLHALPGFIHLPKIYGSAYEATVQRSTNKLASVVNLTADYRGGNNNADWDTDSRSLLGKPATQISLTTSRTYARNRGAGWETYLYQAHRRLFWLFAVEYANFNSQAGFNAQLTAQGYRQGGLSGGVTNINGTAWGNFNGSYPFIPCGHTNNLGNRSGVVDFVMPAEYGELTTSVPSYRGVENPFGHIYKWTDGCKVLIQSDVEGGLSEFYVCDDPALFADSGVEGYQLRGVLPRANGYVSEVLLGEQGEIMPLNAGGGSTTFFCDNFYTSLPASGFAVRGVLFGGSADSGSNAGLAFVHTSFSPSYTFSSFGARLCFIP